MTADVIRNGLDEFLDVAEGSATRALLGEVSKPAFDPIEPGTGRGGKVQVKARMATEPTLDTGMLVGGVVVHDQVQVEFARCLLVEALQEADKFLMPVLRHAVPDDGAVERTQSREQGRRAVALVVVRHGAAAARFHRQARLGSVESLNLALFIDTEHQRLVGRVLVKANDVDELLDKLRIAAHLERRLPVRPQAMLLPNAAHGRFADVLRLGHQAGTPTRGVGRLAAQGGFHNRRSLLVADGREAGRPKSILFEASGPQRQEALTLQLHGRSRGAHLLGDPLALDSFDCQQNDLRRCTRRRLSPGSRQPLQSGPLLPGKENRCGSSAHA